MWHCLAMADILRAIYRQFAGAGLGWRWLNQVDQCRVMTACVSCDAKVASTLLRPPPGHSHKQHGAGAGL